MLYEKYLCMLGGLEISIFVFMLLQYFCFTGAPPVLINIPYNGLCDIRKQDCLRTRVVGYNFIDSENLKCRRTEVQVSTH